MGCLFGLGWVRCFKVCLRLLKQCYMWVTLRSGNTDAVSESKIGINRLSLLTTEVVSRDKIPIPRWCPSDKLVEYVRSSRGLMF